MRREDMKKVCCFPLSESPDYNATVTCTSACCASKMTECKSHTSALSKRSDSVEYEIENIYCCCKTKRVLSQSTREKDKRVEAQLKNE